jgi:hypothetical protein
MTSEGNPVVREMSTIQHIAHGAGFGILFDLTVGVL